MRILGFSFFVILLFSSGCGRIVNEEKPKVREINLGIFDGNPKSNSINKGFRFWRYIKINLNNDSVFLKANQQALDEYENWKKPAEYFTGKLPNQLKNQITSFTKAVHLYPNGNQFNQQEYEEALYCGRDYYLEVREGSKIRYFYFRQGNDTTKPQKIADSLFYFAFNHENLNKTNVVFFNNDDSLISPIVKRRDFQFKPLPPMVKATIKFTPPIKLK